MSENEKKKERKRSFFVVKSVAKETIQHHSQNTKNVSRH